MQGLPQYQAGLESAFDQENYSGRVRHFACLVDPRNYFYTDSQLLALYDLLRDYEAGRLDASRKVENEELWHAKYVLLGNYHPETNQPIHVLFRTSGYVIVTMPIIIGLAFVPPTPLNQFFVQSLNQSFNFAYNFCNGNASNQYSNRELAFSYSMAVGSSILGSLGTLALVNRLRVQQSAKEVLRKLAPIFGVVVANQVNLFFSRIQDFTQGISVRDCETDEEVEFKSQRAAQTAFLQTGLSRFLIPMSIFVLPYSFQYLQARANFQIRNKAANFLVNAGISMASLFVGLTYGLATFPQISRVRAEDLEPQFHNLYNKRGNKITSFYFNKGL